MASTDPAGFDNESTGQFKVMSLAEAGALLGPVGEPDEQPDEQPEPLHYRGVPVPGQLRPVWDSPGHPEVASWMDGVDGAIQMLESFRKKDEPRPQPEYSGTGPYRLIWDALIEAEYAPEEATRLLADHDDRVRSVHTAIRGAVEAATATAQCQSLHVDPATQVAIPVQGPALWFVHSETEQDGTIRGYVSRVDRSDSPLHDTSGELSPEEYRLRLLLKAVIDATRGYLEGGDYS